jgi:hypothetical protein
MKNAPVEPTRAADEKKTLFDGQEVTLAGLQRLGKEGVIRPYTVEILDGEMPASGGLNSLFIDAIGRPLSPVSVCGVRRRERRRN